MEIIHEWSIGTFCWYVMTVSSRADYAPNLHVQMRNGYQ